MPQRYHLVHKGVPINGPKALGKHLTYIQCRDTVRMASGQLIILKNDLTDSDLTGRMLKSPTVCGRTKYEIKYGRSGSPGLMRSHTSDPGSQGRGADAKCMAA